MLNATMVTPSMAIGGAERWIVELIKNTRHAINWTVAISGWGKIDRKLTTELDGLCKSYCNRPLAKFNGFDINLTTNDFNGLCVTGTDFKETINIASEHADVMVTWAIPNIGSLHKSKCPVVYVSHTDVKSPVEICGHTHQVGVSKKALEHFSNRSMPTNVIWNGADPRKTTEHIQQQIKKSWNTNIPIIGQIGRHVPLKRYMLVASALANQPNCALVNYGADPHGDIAVDLYEYCAKHVHQYSLNLPIHNIGDAIVNFDMMVMPSEKEANSLALIEAMLCGVPVISTRVGAIDEFEKMYGTMVYDIPQTIDSNSLYKEIMYRISCNSETMVSNNYQIAVENMTTEVMGKNWVNYLSAII